MIEERIQRSEIKIPVLNRGLREDFPARLHLNKNQKKIKKLVSQETILLQTGPLEAEVAGAVLGHGEWNHS